MRRLAIRQTWIPTVVIVLLGACKSAWTEAQPTDNVLREQASRSADDRDQLRLYLRDGEMTVEGKLAELTPDSVALLDAGDSELYAREDITRIDVRTGHHPVGALIAIAIVGALSIAAINLMVSSAFD